MAPCRGASPEVVFWTRLDCLYLAALLSKAKMHSMSRNASGFGCVGNVRICRRRRRRRRRRRPSLPCFSRSFLPSSASSPKKKNINSSTAANAAAPATLSSKLFSTAGFALVAVSGIALAKPKVEALPHGSTEKQVASAALVFFVTLMLRGCLSLVWGWGLGKIGSGESGGAGAGAAAPASGGAAARPRRSRRA